MDIAQDICGNEAGLYECSFRVVVHFGRRLDETLVRRAVGVVTTGVPILRARFVRGTFGASFAPRRELTGEDLLRVVPADAVDLPALLADGEALEGAMVALRLHRGATDSLVLFADHRLLDGRGAVALAERLLTVYAALEVGGPVPDWRGIPATRQLRPPLRHFARGLVADTWRALTNRARPAFPTIGADRRQPRYVTAELSGGAFERVRRYAREQGATVTDVLVAALLRRYTELAALPAAGPHGCYVVVDQRRHLRGRPLHPVSNAGGMTYLTVRGEVRDLSDGVVRVRDAMEGQKRSPLFGFADCFLAALLLTVLPRAWVAKLVRRTARTFSDGRTTLRPTLSNVGALSLDGVGPSLALRDVVLYPPIRYGPPVVTAFTYGQRLRLVCGYSAGCHDPSLMQGLVDGIANDVRSAA
jgi:NRPS condensation-like uncharacterized protein